MLSRNPMLKPQILASYFTKPVLTTRSFHSVYHADIPVLDDSTLENRILSKAYNNYVPVKGFTEESINLAIKELDLNPNNLEGVFNLTSESKSLTMELILYHLRSTRMKLADYQREAEQLTTEKAKVRYYLTRRLLDNQPVIKFYHQALARMILPSNLTESLNELHNLSDDISFYSGDKSNDFAWYTKRFSLSGVFIQSELFMLNDKSDGHSKTIEFMNDRMDEVDAMGYAYSSFEEWMLFNGFSTVNLIKSQIARG